MFFLLCHRWFQERLGEVEREREEGEKTWSRKTEELGNKVTEVSVRADGREGEEERE